MKSDDKDIDKELRAYATCAFCLPFTVMMLSLTSDRHALVWRLSVVGVALLTSGISSACFAVRKRELGGLPIRPTVRRLVKAAWFLTMGLLVVAMLGEMISHRAAR